VEKDSIICSSCGCCHLRFVVAVAVTH